MIRTFQLAKCRAGIFFSYSFAWCDVAIFLLSFTLSSKHPLKQADRGGSAPYWLGDAQLEADGSGPLGHDDPSHRRRQPVASYPSPNRLDLSLVTATGRVFSAAGQQHRSDLSGAQNWAWFMETQGCPDSRIPLPASPVRSRGTQSNTSGTRLAAGAARKKSMSTSSCLRGSTPDFSSELTSEAFPMNGYAARQRRFEIRVFLLLDELASQVVEPHLPEATGFKAPEIRPSPFPCQ